MTIQEILNRNGLTNRECIADIVRMCQPFLFDKNETIVIQGLPCDDMIFIENGILRIGLDKNNHEDTLCFGGEGDVFISFHTYFSGEPSPFKLTSMTSGSAYRLPLETYTWLEHRWPELITWMRNMLVEQLYSFEGLYSNFALSSSQERLDNFWKVTPAALRAIPAADLSKTVALKYIAQYLGIAQQTLSRIRRRLVGK